MKRQRHPHIAVLVVAIFLATAIPLSARAQPQSNVNARQAASPALALFVVGKAGDNLWPLSVTIYIDGTVKGFWR
jgi:hypothetical protein